MNHSPSSALTAKDYSTLNANTGVDIKRTRLDLLLETWQCFVIPHRPAGCTKLLPAAAVWVQRHRWHEIEASLVTNGVIKFFAGEMRQSCVLGCWTWMSPVCHTWWFHVFQPSLIVRVHSDACHRHERNFLLPTKIQAMCCCYDTLRIFCFLPWIINKQLQSDSCNEHIINLIWLICVKKTLLFNHWIIFYKILWQMWSLHF